MSKRYNHRIKRKNGVRRPRVTTVAAMICSDGLVMGSDTKVVGGDMKYSENKIEEFSIGDSPLIIGGAGSLRHCKDAIRWMQLDNVDEKLGRDKTFNHFLDTIVESSMPDFVNDYKIKYGCEPEIEMLVGSIDEGGTPRLVQLYSDGDYDHMERYCATGTGAIFGEVLLRKLYKPEIKVNEAERLIAYIIWEIQSIDNYSGLDMQLVCLSTDKTVRQAKRTDVEAYKQIPRAIHKAYQELYQEIQGIDAQLIKDAIENLNNALGIEGT